MSKKEISFTEGPVFQSLLRFAIPVLGALILQAAYGAVDLLIVGKFGNASSISAVGTGSSFMQMATFIITSLAMGSTVIIGHHIGEQKPKEAGNAVGTTIILFLIIAVIMTFVLEFAAGGIAHLLQAPAESFDKTILYIRICSAGIVIIIAYNVISGVLRGVGNANLPLLFVGIACVINILGDLLLVGVFHMDVAGAAIATVFAQFVSVVCSVVVLRKQDMPIEFSREQCRIYKEELGKILNVGVPIALQETTVQISFLVVNSVINQMGLMPSAGYGIAQKIVSFIMLVPSSIMQSVSAFVAQNIGAGKTERIPLGFRTGLKLSEFTALPFVMLYFIFSRQMMGLFLGAESVEAISAGMAFLKIVSPWYFMIAIKLMTDGIIRGSGAMVYFVVATVPDLILRIGFALVLTKSFGSTGIWMAWPFGWIVATTLTLIFYRKLGYKNDKSSDL